MRASSAAAFFCGLTCLATSSLASAQIAIDSTTLSLNFLGFTGAGIVPSPGAGQLSSNSWAVTGLSDGDLVFGGDGSTADFTRGESNGNVATGGIYAFRTASNDVCLGVQPAGGDFTPGTLTARFRNDLPRALRSIDLSYEIWELPDEPRSNSFNLSYSTDGTTFTPVPSADFASSEAIPTSPAWTLHTRSVSLLTTVEEDAFFYLRWTSDDISGSGNRDAFCLDDIVVRVNDFCGDGVKALTEECDDGNGSNTDGCLDTCEEASCGDGFINAETEDCDGEGASECCSLACQFADGASCSTGTCLSGVCQPSSGGGGEAGDTSGGGSPDPGSAGEGGEQSEPGAGEGGAPARGGSGPRGGTSGRGGSAGTTAGRGGNAGRGGTSGSPATGGAANGGSGGDAGGQAGDSSNGEADDGDDSGCGCRVPRGANASDAGLGLGVALLAFALRRRQKRAG